MHSHTAEILKQYTMYILESDQYFIHIFENISRSQLHLCHYIIILRKGTIPEFNETLPESEVNKQASLISVFTIFLLLNKSTM